MERGAGANSIKEAEKAEKAEAKKVFAMRQEHWLRTFCENEEVAQLLVVNLEEGDRDAALRELVAGERLDDRGGRAGDQAAAVLRPEVALETVS